MVSTRRTDGLQADSDKTHFHVGGEAKKETWESTICDLSAFMDRFYWNANAIFELELDLAIWGCV
jgi:hypothetical protein